MKRDREIENAGEKRIHTMLLTKARNLFRNQEINFETLEGSSQNLLAACNDRLEKNAMTMPVPEEIFEEIRRRREDLNHEDNKMARPEFFLFIRSRTECVSGPDRIGTETVKGPF